MHFGGFVALDGAGRLGSPGEVVGLIGPNGAGKTTLFNVITGLVHEQGGTVHLGDRDLSDATPVDVARAGLARTFQNLRLFKNLSVRENVSLTSLVAGRHRATVSAPTSTSCSPTPASPSGPTATRARSTTATSAGSNSPAPPRWRRSSCCSTNRRRA